MADFRITQTGEQLQHILDNAVMEQDFNNEVSSREGADQTLHENIDAEETRAKAAEKALQDNIDAEELARQQADNTLQGEIDGIDAKIPADASSSNKLTTKEYVDDSVATNTATFRGTFNLVSDLHLTVDATHENIGLALGAAIATADNNDYAFVLVPTSVETPTQIQKIERFKFNGTVWAFEFELNNSGFTASQWAAINSGITSGLVAKLGNLPTATELANALTGKQDVLTFDNVPTEGSNNPVKSGGVYAADKALSDAIEAILLLIPSAASALNQLADKAFVNSSIGTNTATFRGTYNAVADLGLGVNATHAQIAAALANVITSQVDNNDYCFVQIPTAVATPTEIEKTERYKFNGTAWAFEYDLNTSGFTAAQWAAINSGIVAAFIPSETTALNPLADKAYVLAQILAATPTFKGQFTSLADLQAVQSPKAGDLGIVRTTDSDGYAVFTFYQYLNNQWNVFYTLSHHNQNKPATTGTTGDYPYNGMGRLVLDKNVDFKAQIEAVAGGNTIFVICYDFILTGNVNIPANSVLLFEGGSISGAHTMTMNGCYIDGDAHFGANTSFSGFIKNGMFNVLWLDDSDLGAKFNHANINFNDLCLPSTGSIEYTTPIDINCTNLDIKATLVYSGTITNNKWAFRLSGDAGNIYICGLEIVGGINNTTIDFSENRTVNFIGLCLWNMSQSHVQIGTIIGFNEGVRFWAEGSDCSMNYLFMGRLYNYNFGVRFYQTKGSNNTTGWCHENTLRVMNPRNLGKTISQKYAFFLAGLAADNVTYKDLNDIDERDVIDSISIYDCCFENHTYPIYTRNASNLSIINCREENLTGLLKSVGLLDALKYIAKYNDALLTSDFDHLYRFSLRGYLNEKIIVKVGQYDCCVESPFSTNVMNFNTVLMLTDNQNLYKDNYVSFDRFHCYNGVIIPYQKIIDISVSENAKIACMFLDENFNNITYDTLVANNIKYGNYYGYFGFVCIDNDQTKQGYMRRTGGTTIPVPSSVKYIFIGVIGSETPQTRSTELRLSPVPSQLIVHDVPICGTTSERPSYYPGTVSYFDRTIKKNIYYWDGWVDGAGNAV